MPASDDDDRVALLVARLSAIRATHGRLPRGVLKVAAAQVGIPQSTLARYLAKGLPSAADRPRFRWTAELVPYLQVSGGDVTFARELIAADHGEEGLPQVRQLQRAVRRDLDPATIVEIKHGHRAAMQMRTVLRVEQSRRNELWLADHKQLDVWAVPLRGSKPIKPWMTIILDSYSRRLLGAALSIRPNQGHVLAALRSAIARAGVPEGLLFDRGLEFTADAITRAAGDLVFSATATQGYRPEHKGKVEAVAKTIGRRVVRGLPQRTQKPIDRRGRPLPEPPEEPLTFEDLITRFYECVDAYNHAPHSSLDRSTPIAVYEADLAPERLVDAALLRRFLLKARDGKVREHGIRFANNWYWNELLEGHRHMPVEIRYAPDDLTVVEIYRDGRHWCTAPFTDPAGPAMREKVTAVRRRNTQERARGSQSAQARAAASRRDRRARPGARVDGDHQTRRGRAAGRHDALRRRVAHAGLDNRHRRRQADELMRHYLGLERARVLRTPYWTLGREGIHDAVHERAIASITGPPGTGKSFLLDCVAAEIREPVLRIEFNQRPTMLSVTDLLLEALTDEVIRGRTYQKIKPLAAELAKRRTIFVDEAQRLNRECLDHLRYLHDRDDTDFCLVLAGGEGCWEVLGSEPQLRRRIYRPVFFRPLSIDEIKVAIPKFHPIWSQTSATLIERIDVEFAQGKLGNWASVTKTMEGTIDGQQGLTTDVMLATLVRHGVLDGLG